MYSNSIFSLGEKESAVVYTKYLNIIYILHASLFLRDISNNPS